MSWSQTALDNTRRTLLRSPLHPFRALKRMMPRGLFGRSLIIILAPMLILQAVVTEVFFDRHYRIVTATMLARIRCKLMEDQRHGNGELRVQLDVHSLE